MDGDGDSDYEPTLDDPVDAAMSALRKPDDTLNKKRKSSGYPSPTQANGAKKARLHEETPHGVGDVLLSGLDRSKQLPAEIWHHIFTYLPPKDLGRLLTINKIFHIFLSPSPVAQPPSAANSATPCILSALKPEVIWRASRRLWWPRMPAPLKGMSEYDMWRIACSSSCQFCSIRDDSQLSRASDQWHRGPGAKGVAPVFPFSFVCCGNCLAAKTTKDIDVLLSSTVPSALLPGLPAAFLTDQLHVVPPQVLKTGSMPPHVKLTKIFWPQHLEQIKSEFESVKLLGSAAAEEWLKGLETRGKKELADASRWERFYLSGGVHRMRTWKSLVPPSPDEDEERDNLAAVVAPSIPVQPVEQPPQIQVHNLPQYQAPSNGIPGLSSRTDVVNIQPRLTGQPKRTKEEVAELKARRKAEIEHRALLLDPPLSTDVLAHIPSFQAALQISTPLDDNAWDILKPRLLAQRQEAEKRLAQITQAARNTQVKQEPAKTEAEAIKGSKTVTDEEWDDAQGDLRARILYHAEQIINDGWGGGEKVNKENSPQFAAEVLVYVRKRFYAEVAKDAAAALAAGQEPIVDPPQGPWTRKLTLENMKWIFHFLVKPITDAHRKDLFLCNDCGVHSKFYGLEAVVQHYAAKHTTAFSLGSVVVNWRTEWPEKPPFSPDPRLPDPAEVGQLARQASQPHQPKYQPPTRTQVQPVSTAYQPTAPPVFPYPAPPPPVAYGQQAAFPSTSPYGVPPYGTFPPQTASLNSHYPSYDLRPPYEHPAPPPEQPLEYGHYTAPAQYGFQGSYPEHQETYGGAQSDSPYKVRLDAMADVVKTTWPKIANIKSLPAAVKVCVVVHFIAKRFQQEFQIAPALSMLNDALSSHQGIRVMRNTNGLACKACSQGPKSTSRSKTLTLPQLVNHFRKDHIEGPRLEGLQPLDWRTEMVLLPDISILRELDKILEHKKQAYELVADTLPWAFEDAEPDLDAGRQFHSGKPSGLPPDGFVPEINDRYPTSGSDEYEPHLSETEVSRADRRTPKVGAPPYSQPGYPGKPQALRRASPPRPPPYTDDRSRVPDLRPASAVYTSKGTQKNDQQRGAPSPKHEQDCLSIGQPGTVPGGHEPIDLERLHPDDRHMRPGSASAHEQDLGGHVGVEYYDAHRAPFKEGDPREDPTPMRSWESNGREGEAEFRGRIPTSTLSATLDTEPRRLDPLESHLDRAHDNVVYVDPSGRELRKTSHGTFVYVDEPVPEPARHPVLQPYEPYSERYMPDHRHEPIYDQSYRHQAEPAPRRVYYDSRRAEAYELLEVRDPQGDYYIRRPVRRDERDFYPPEPRAVLREAGGYQATYHHVQDQPPPTRGPRYAVDHRATTMAPVRPPSRSAYEEYDPKYPAVGSGPGETASRYSAR